MGWHFYFTLAHTHLQPDDPVEALKGNSKLKVIDLQIIYLGKEGYKSAIELLTDAALPYAGMNRFPGYWHVYSIKKLNYQEQR